MLSTVRLCGFVTAGTALLLCLSLFGVCRAAEGTHSDRVPLDLSLAREASAPWMGTA
jgi:hypothetical protein